MWCSASSGTLRWAVSRSAVPGVVAKTHRNGETKNKERSIGIEKIVKVETGTGQFPGSQGTKGEQAHLTHALTDGYITCCGFLACLEAMQLASRTQVVCCYLASSPLIDQGHSTAHQFSSNISCKPTFCIMAANI